MECVMIIGCNERFDPEMAKWIWNFNKQNRKHYYELLDALQEKQVYILRSRREVTKFLREI